jgi:uncharacterized protein YjbJ (UPF0337 family)
MDGIKWNSLKESIMERWGSLTEEELDQSQGDFDYILTLIQRKYSAAARDETRAHLSEIYRTHQEGHPMLDDHFKGIEEVKNKEEDGVLIDSRDPSSQEWQAREDIQHQNKDSNKW